MKPCELDSYFDTKYKVSALDVLNRCLRRIKTNETSSLGKCWSHYQELWDQLGSYEFEIFLQTNLDAMGDKIEERGFYPSILIREDSIDVYENNRDALLEAWSNPSLRYQDKIFSECFSDELQFENEVCSRFYKDTSCPIESVYIDELAQRFDDACGWFLTLHIEPKNAHRILTGETLNRWVMAHSHALQHRKANQYHRELKRAETESLRVILTRNAKSLMTKDIVDPESEVPLLLQALPHFPQKDCPEFRGISTSL